MAHQIRKRSRLSSTGSPESVETAVNETLAQAVKDQLRNARIVQLEGEVTELELTIFG